MQEFSFEEFKPPPLAPNGRVTEIAGRPAWVGTSLPAEVDASCGTTFGAADGSVTVILLDQTENRPEPCATLVELAEIVASRTPPPTK